MSNDHPAIEAAKQNADAAKKHQHTHLAEKIVRAILASPEKAEDYIVTLQDTLLDIYRTGRWDGMQDATNVLKNGTKSEQIAAKQIELVAKDNAPIIRGEKKAENLELPKYGLPCPMCGTYGESGKPCAVCEVRKQRGMLPS